MSSIVLNIFEMILVILPIDVLVQRYWLRKINLLEGALFFAGMVLVFPLSIKTLPFAVICEGLAMTIHFIRNKNLLEKQALNS